MKKLIILSLLSLLLIGCSSIKTANIHKSADVWGRSLHALGYDDEDFNSTQYNTVMFEEKMVNYTNSLMYLFGPYVFMDDYAGIENILSMIDDPEILNITVYDEYKIIAYKSYSVKNDKYQFIRYLNDFLKLEIVFCPQNLSKKEMINAKAKFYKTIFRKNLTESFSTMSELINNGSDFSNSPTILTIQQSFKAIMEDHFVISVRYVDAKGKKNDYIYLEKENSKFKEKIYSTIDLIGDDNISVGSVIIEFGIN